MTWKRISRQKRERKINISKVGQVYIPASLADPLEGYDGIEVWENEGQALALVPCHYDKNEHAFKLSHRSVVVKILDRYAGNWPAAWTRLKLNKRGKEIKALYVKLEEEPA